MVRTCSWCGKHIGEKEPLEDKTETHGICDKCAQEVEKKELNDKEEKMTKEKKEVYTGGPAFPQPNQVHPENDKPYLGAGMTLRDYFAGMALQPFMQSITYKELGEKNNIGGDDMNIEQLTSRECYRYADAMLAEREK